MAESKPGLLGLERALDAAGGTMALTGALGCSPGVVGNWRREGGIPASRVPEVARVTGLSPGELRPDLFPRAEARAGFAETGAPLGPQARALGLDPDAIAGKALREAIGREKARRWAEENREAIEAWNRHFEENDTPLAEHRAF